MMTLHVSADDLTRFAGVLTLLGVVIAFWRGLLTTHRRTGAVSPSKPEHLRAEIERLTARLTAARDFVTQAGGRRCDKCGAVAAGRANYCPRCGVALSSAAVAEVSARDVNAIMRGLADPRLKPPPPPPVIRRGEVVARDGVPVGIALTDLPAGRRREDDLGRGIEYFK